MTENSRGRLSGPYKWRIGVSVVACTAFLMGMVALYTAAVPSPYSQVGKTLYGENPGDESGRSVSLSADGTVVAIGAPRNPAGSTYSQEIGHTRVFAWNGFNWIQRGGDIDGEESGYLGNSGKKVVLNATGTVVAVGAPESDGVDLYAGDVRVYEWRNGHWRQRGPEIDGEIRWSETGYGVDLSDSGDTVAVGSQLNDASDPTPGYTRIFDWNGADWIQRGERIYGTHNYDASGHSVSLSADGNSVAIGAWNHEIAGLGQVGTTRVYDWVSDRWVQRGADINGEFDGENSGSVVSLSAEGDRLCVGGWETVRVFEWSGAAWLQLGAVISADSPYDLTFSNAVLSGDGAVLAISQGGYASGATAVRVFRWTDDSWSEIGSPLQSNDAGDLARGLDLSRDGTVIAAGSPRNDAAGTDAGSTRVFTTDKAAFAPDAALLMWLLQRRGVSDEAGYR